jgi:Flp pilus assembly protein TadD
VTTWRPAFDVSFSTIHGSRALHGLIEVLLQNGKLDEALDKAWSAAQLRPDDPWG